MKKIVLSITISRLLASPLIFFFSVFLEYHWMAFWLFIYASLTDYLDGKLSRAFKAETRLGAIIDPIADKVLIVFAILAIVSLSDNFFTALIGGFILSREFFISALREYTSHLGNSDATKVTYLAKIKTTVQFIAITMHFFGIASNFALIIFLADFMLLLAMLIAYKSLIDYFSSAYNEINK